MDIVSSFNIYSKSSYSSEKQDQRMDQGIFLNLFIYYYFFFLRNFCCPLASTL